MGKLIRRSSYYSILHAAKNMCSESGQILVPGNFGTESHNLCITIQQTEDFVVLSEMSSLADLELSENLSPSKTQATRRNWSIATGYNVEPPHGAAYGYIGDDGFFYGTLHINNRTLYAELPHSSSSLDTTITLANDTVTAPQSSAFSEDITMASVHKSLQNKPATYNPNFGLFESKMSETPFLPNPSNISLSEYETSSVKPGVSLSNSSLDAANTETQYPDINKNVNETKNNESRSVRKPRFLEKRSRGSEGYAPGLLCELLVLADYSYYRLDANSSVDQVVKRMLHAVAQSDIIFRNTDFDFDGQPDNVGFTVKHAVVITSEEMNDLIMGNSSESVVDGHSYLMSFSRLKTLRDVCLGIAFSGLFFKNNTLGLSFTALDTEMAQFSAGICHRMSIGRSYNTLVVSHGMDLNDHSRRLSDRVAAVTLAHELGHSFGAKHDEEYSEDACTNYLMSARSMSDFDRRMEFSNCSRRRMADTIKKSGFCLKANTAPFCGNGLVEEGESCDCGSAVRCEARDRCCTPHVGTASVTNDGSIHLKGCSVSPKVDCHPSEGVCCTRKCTFANLTDHGIDCSLMRHGCENCTEGWCPCGLGGMCLPSGACHAQECARLGLEECQCPDHGPGGSLAAQSMCGVCCRLPYTTDREDQETCVGEEQALGQVDLDSIPHNITHSRYRGHALRTDLLEGVCDKCGLRGWLPGRPCLSMGKVGLCDPVTTMCRPHRTTKRHIFPLYDDIYHYTAQDNADVNYWTNASFFWENENISLGDQPIIPQMRSILKEPVVYNKVYFIALSNNEDQFYEYYQSDDLELTQASSGQAEMRLATIILTFLFSICC